MPQKTDEMSDIIYKWKPSSKKSGVSKLEKLIEFLKRGSYLYEVDMKDTLAK